MEVDGRTDSGSPTIPVSFLDNRQRGGLHALAAVDGEDIGVALDQFRAVGQIDVAVVMATCSVADEEGGIVGREQVVVVLALELRAPAYVAFWRVKWG